MQITICPPAAARGAFFDKPHDQYFHPQLSSEATFRGKDEWESNGISISDLSLAEGRGGNMSLRNHGGRGVGRRLGVPDWTQNDSATRRVVLEFLEQRAFSKQQRARLKGRERSRLVRVIQVLKEKSAAQIVVMDRLCAEYVSCFDDAYRRVLESQIKSLDTSLRLVDRPDIVIGLVHGYYREHASGKDLAERFGMTHDHVRQMLFRLNIVAKRLGYTIPQTTSEELAQRRRARESVTKEMRAARREERSAEKRAAREAAKILAAAQKQTAKWDRYTKTKNRDYSPAEVADIAGVARPVQKPKAAPNPERKPKEPRPNRERALTRSERIALGLCPFCAQKPVEGKRLCAVHVAYFRQKTREHWEQIKKTRVLKSKEEISRMMSAAAKARWAKRKAAAVTAA